MKGLSGRLGSEPMPDSGSLLPRQAAATRHRVEPLTLVQPPSLGRVSGGYLFNAEMLWRLERDGNGQVLSVPRGALDSAEPSHRNGTLLLDSLYLNDSPISAMELLANTARRTCLLVHYLPSSNPALDPREKARARAREREWIRHVELVITTSQATADYVESITSSKPRVVQPGVTDVFRSARRGPSQNDTCYLVTVGSLCAGKDQLFVLRCLKELPAQRYVWNIVGDHDADPDYVARLQHAIREAEMVNRVRLLRTMNHTDIAALFDQSHLYVSASRFESYGMATAEAACHGIPTLCYGVGACDRWIEHGTNGLVYDTDDELGFRLGLQRLLMDQESLSALERNGSDTDTSTHRFPTWEESYRDFVDAIFSS